MKELSGLWSVLVGIGALIAFGTWIKTSLMSLDKRVGILEKQLDIHAKKELELQAQTVERLVRIETKLEMIFGQGCARERDE